MRIAVTGGAGYVGTELVKQLAVNTDLEEIIVYDNLSRGNYNLFPDYPLNISQKVTFVNGDILDSRKLEKIFDGIDIVYHLAANVTTPYANTDPHLYEQVNHWGTADVGYSAEKANVKRLVYLSSVSVYGASVEMVNESTIPDPKTYYGISKYRGEKHLEPLMDKMEVLIVRCGNVYGYSHSMRFDAVINRFVFEANFFNRISIQGDGKQTRAFIHIDTASRVLSDLAVTKIPSGVYNMVEANYMILNLLDALKEIKPEMEFLFVDQHLTLRTMKVDPEVKLRAFVPFPDRDTLQGQLRVFLKHFSF